MNHETVLTLPDIPRLDWDRVALIIPRYQDNGSSISQLYYDDGTYDLVKCSCNAILNAFAWHHVTKVDIAKKLTLSCPHYPNQRRVCLAFSPNCTLVPLIVRSAKRYNNGTLGYLVKEKLYDTVPLTEGGTLIKLAPDHEGIAIMQREPTVRKQLAAADLLKHYYLTIVAERQAELPPPHAGVGRYR